MSKRIPIIIGLLLICLSIWLQITASVTVRQFMDRLENLGYDLQLRTHILTEKFKPVGSIVIIDIDDKSLKIEGRWPWPREKVAAIVDKLQSEGASVIAFDIFFSEQESNIAQVLTEALTKAKLTTPDLLSALKKIEPAFAGDEVLANSLAKSYSVLAIGFLPRNNTENILPKPMLALTKDEQTSLNLYKASGYISNIPLLQQAAKGGGFINIFPDTDGIIRRAPLVIEYNGAVYPSLALQSVLTYLGEKASLVTPVYHDEEELEGVKIGEQVIPTDAKGQVLIPFIGRSYTFPYYSATDVLHDNVAKDAFLGKIAVFGASATGLGDLKGTSIENPFPGVEIQATLMNGLLQNNFSYKPAWTFGANLFLTLLLGIIAAFLLPYFGPRILALIILLLPPTLLFINNWIWKETGLILSFLTAVMLVLLIALFNIIYGYLFESRRREHLKEMFGQYVPEKHIDDMLKKSGDYGMQGEDRDMSVLFADIRNFTTISEGLTASELVNLLNTFFTPMTEIIFKHQGTIDKYVGDLIMAFWGAPLRDKRHARHAIQSALGMIAQLKKMQTTMTEKNWPSINIGIGINSGVMSVGDMGSRFRRNYTVLGDTVNLASRVEGLTKHYGVDIIVTENTMRNQEKFVFRKLDRVRVKGKMASIEIYEVICTQKKASSKLLDELKQYHEALAYYFEKQWEPAEKILLSLQAIHPKVKIYQIYLDRIKEYKIHPLPDDWDGVYVHTTK